MVVVFVAPIVIVDIIIDVFTNLNSSLRGCRICVHLTAALYAGAVFIIHRRIRSSMTDRKSTTKEEEEKKIVVSQGTSLINNTLIMYIL